MKAFKIVISKEKQLAMNNSINRELSIENGTNTNTHRVHKNKKAYNRREGKKVVWE